MCNSLIRTLRPRSLMATAALILAMAGCSSSHNASDNTTSTTPASTGGSATSASTAATTTSTPAAATDLSGNWSGTYSGSFSGTFSLSWQQTGANLSGTIMISSLGNKSTAINGTLQGNSIHFGTVGSEAISYTGSVSGSSMSGDWQIAAGGKTLGSGTWKASKG